ncbi:MAG: PepSY domain-containing protein [Bradyrhizobiaceae bacterium]|nr:PepSY domain-containing protein [Bradyrhizobiaceae bacterium]
MRNSSFKVAAAIFGGAALLKISALAVAVAVLGLATSAQAGSLGRPCTSAPQNQWLSMQELQAKVEALGYKMRKAKLKNACGELYTLDKNGNRVELFVDPTNGQIVGQL